MIRALALLALVTGAPARAEPTPLPIRLLDGATWTQTVAHTQTNDRNGVVTTWTQTSVSKATLSRPASGPATLRQDPVSAKTSEGAPADIVASGEFVFPVVIEVDAGLRPQRIVNWPDLRAAMDAYLPKLVRDPKQLENARAQIARMDDRQSVGNLLRDQALLGLGQGTLLELGQARTYDDQTPNALGGPPIAMKGAFKLESFDKRQRRAVVTWTRAMDPASSAASLEVAKQAMIARLPPEQAAKARTDLEGMAVTRTDACRFEVDVGTGLAVTADCTTAVRSGTPTQFAARTERWLMTQTLPEAR